MNNKIAMIHPDSNRRKKNTIVAEDVTGMANKFNNDNIKDKVQSDLTPFTTYTQVKPIYCMIYIYIYNYIVLLMIVHLHDSH